MVPLMQVINTLAPLMLVTASAISEERDLVKCAYIYVVQTLLLVGVFAALSTKYYWFVFWAASATITKAVLSPYVIVWAAKKTRKVEEEPPVIPRMPSILILMVLVVLGFALASLYSAGEYMVVLGSSLALTMQGLFILSTKRNILKQVFGFLHFENGAHLTLAVLAPSIPETVEAGIASDAIVLVVVLAFIARMVYDSLGTLNVRSLSMLKYS